MQDDLLRIPGVEGAEVDGSQDAPAGLRIRIAEGADQEAVGEAIRGVLSSHGLGTDTQLPGEDTSSPATELERSSIAVMTSDDEELSSESDLGDQEVGAVIDLTDKASEAIASEEDAADDFSDDDNFGDDDNDEVEPADSTGAGEDDLVPPFVEQRRPVADRGAAEDVDVEVEEAHASTDAARDSIARIDSVAVVEGRSGIIVTVTASNRTEMSHVASSSEGGVEAAVVKAAARLVDPSSPDPIVVEIEDRRVEGVDIVMIVLDMDGELCAGSAVVGAGRAFALGRATWAALAL